MSEHTDLLPMHSPEDAAPVFDLVRRGYDRDQVDSHLAWLEDRVREAEAAREMSEASAADALAAARRAHEELESGRPDWASFGGRIAQMLELAEQQGAEICAQRQREATELHERARRTAAEAEQQHAARVREAEGQAAEILKSAQADADRIIRRAQQQAQEEERASARRLADLERQRDAVNAQLSRLHAQLAAALQSVQVDMADEEARVIPQPQG